MREIVLDTETTGLDVSYGHRVVEVGCVEMIDRKITGKTWHSYFNPERMMPKDAAEVHGLKDDFLADKPLFADKAADLLAFIGDAQLVAHNAPFDLAFLNMELEKAGYPQFPAERIIDTMELTRTKLPGAPNTLAALCKRFKISTKKRSKHGALIDAELLAEVYLELLAGDRQGSLILEVAEPTIETPIKLNARRPARVSSRLTEQDIAAHRAFIATIKNPIWLEYWQPEEMQEAA